MEESMKWDTAKEESARSTAADKDKAGSPMALHKAEALPSPDKVSALGLAYIGDTVFDLLVRTSLLAKANEPVNRLNKKATALVNAESQSRMIDFQAEALDGIRDGFQIFHREIGRSAAPQVIACDGLVPDHDAVELDLFQQMLHIAVGIVFARLVEHHILAEAAAGLAERNVHIEAEFLLGFDILLYRFTDRIGIVELIGCQGIGP